MQVKETRNNPRPGDGTPGPGRPKGVPNKTTTLLKDAVLKAAETAGGGGPDGLVNYLVAQAKQNPGPFMTLLGKVLPTQVSGEDDELRITIRNIVVEERRDTEPPEAGRGACRTVVRPHTAALPLLPRAHGYK
jgi:hypothetical protein